MPPTLSPRTRDVVEKIFNSRHFEEAARRLKDECGNNLQGCKAV